MVLPITNPASIRFASRYRSANGSCSSLLTSPRSRFRYLLVAALLIVTAVFTLSALLMPGMPATGGAPVTGVEPVVARPAATIAGSQRGEGQPVVRAAAGRKLQRGTTAGRAASTVTGSSRNVGGKRGVRSGVKSKPSLVPIAPAPVKVKSEVAPSQSPNAPPPQEEVQVVDPPAPVEEPELLLAPSQLPAAFRDPEEEEALPPPPAQRGGVVKLSAGGDKPELRLPPTHEYATGSDIRFHTPYAPTHAFRLDAGLDVYRMGTPTLSHGPASFPTLAAQAARQDAIREAFLHSWRPYVEYAWGRDTLKPVSKSSDDGFLHMGITITDSLDTMLIMGLREEYAQGVEWVVKQLKFDHQKGINTFESTIRVLGGLLAAWDLDGRTNDALLSQARAAGDALAVAFDTPTGLPHSTLDLASRSGYNVGGGSSISEVATLQLEWEWLSYATGEPRYAMLSRRVMMHLQTIEPGSDSLWGMYISPESGVIGSSTITLGARGDSLYEYLLKQYLLAGGLRGATSISGNDALLRSASKTTDYAPAHTSARAAWAATASMPVYACADAVLDECNGGSGRSGAYARDDAPITAESEVAYWRSILGMYWRSMAGVESQLWRTSHGPGKYAYIAERHGESAYDDKMDHLVCFVPGMLALGAAVAPTPALAEHHMQLAADLMRTCVHMYEQTATHLAAEITRVYGGGDPSPDHGAKHNLLRPETVESLLIMYRVTGDEKWREAGWEIFKAFNTTSRVPDGGFTTIHDVTVMPPQPRDVQESFWLAETLKYLYLLFSDSDTVPLDKYVFNTEAHPLRVFEPVGVTAGGGAR